jgi:3-dehydroquinate synthase
VYLDLPGGFATQVAVLEKLLPEYLPASNWLLLGEQAVRSIWQSCSMPEPPISNWVNTSEETKRMETILPWLEGWAARGVHRKYTLVALGGGVLTDMGGLAASLYMRGIAWHSWPTSLLAQADAGIGGKTAVNLDSGKNLAGAFHHPARMVIASDFLYSLPLRHRESGKWELIKMSLIDGDLDWARSLLHCKTPDVSDIKRAVQMKADIVHRDFKENGERRLLNLGHTLGHALESASGFALLHGEAVGLGALAACLLSESLDAAVFPPDFIKKMAERLAPLAPRVPSWELCLPFLRRDKKTESENELRFIIPIPGARPVQQKISPEVLETIHAKLLLMLNIH